MTARRWVAVMVCAAVAWTAVPAPASAQDPGPGPAEAPAPAPEGFAGELVALFRSLHAVVELGAAAGAPPAGVASPADFATHIAELDDDDLARLHAASESQDLPALSRDLDDGVAAMETTLAAATAPATAIAAAAAGPPDAGGREFPPIETPPPPFTPSEPVEASDLPPCPELPPGPDFGAVPLFTVRAAKAAISAVAEGLSEELIITVAILPAVDLHLTVPNPAKIAAELAVELANVAELTLQYLRDRYDACGALHLFEGARTIENVTQQLYALMTQADGTIGKINDGLIIVSDQVRHLEASADQVQRLGIERALTAPLTVTPNVAYVLPAAEGGYLDASPVGVRQVVTDALEAALDAGHPVSPTAPLYVTLAGHALGQGRYLDAYRAYQRAYQGLAR